MPSKKSPPPGLLASRPALLDDPNVHHPSMGERTGAPPHKYTRALHDRICEELKKGQRAQGACARAGITTATFYEWVRRGKGGDPWLYEFAEDVEIAFNEAEASAVDTVTEAGFRATSASDRDPELALKWLQVARSDGYSKQVKTTVDNQIRDFLIRLERALDPPTFERVLAVYLGQAPTVELGHKEIAVLPAHDETEEGDSAEE